MTPEHAQVLGAGLGMFAGSGLATWGVRMLARAVRAARAPAAAHPELKAKDLSQTPAEASAAAYYARISAGRPSPLPIVPSVIPKKHSLPSPVVIDWEIPVVIGAPAGSRKSPGQPPPLAPVAGEILSKHSQGSPAPTKPPGPPPPLAPTVDDVDWGAQARARAREVRDAVAGLGWPIARATWAAEAALAKLGGGCPELEEWVPTALRELAPPARGQPNLGPVQRRPRLR